MTVEIAAGETVGIIGANGAGKTTFVNMVTGYLKPDEGVILFRGVDITRMPPREVTRLGIRRSFQVAQLFPNLSVRDNVLVALACAERTRPTPTGILRTPARLVQANEILGRHWGSRALPIGRRPNSRRASASCLTSHCAMVGRSAVLLLDEPTSGVSAQEKLPLMDLVMEAVAAESAAVLFVEHDMEVVERYAPRVIAFYEGRVIADGTPAAVLADADVRRYVVGAELHRRTEGAKA